MVHRVVVVVVVEMIQGGLRNVYHSVKETVGCGRNPEANGGTVVMLVVVVEFGVVHQEFADGHVPLDMDVTGSRVSCCGDANHSPARLFRCHRVPLGLNDRKPGPEREGPL